MGDSKKPRKNAAPLTVGWAAYAPLSGAVFEAGGESVMTREQFAALQSIFLPETDLAALSARPAGTPDEEAPPPVGTAVWLTEWQVAEIHLDVGVGDHVDWMLVPMDVPWLNRLFGERRTVDLQLDLYAEEFGRDTHWASVAGSVVGIEVVRCPMQQSTDPEDRGWIPVPGEAWTTQLDRTIHLPFDDADNVYGFIVYVRED
jgi:hypothetical protein